MKKLLLAILASCSISLQTAAQCNETDVTRVLLIGDSWAQFIGTDNVINTTFEKWGHSNYKFYTNATLAENGTQTTDFLDTVRLNEIAARLAQFPDIDLIHLSLGGNDVLNSWNVNFSAAQTDSLLDSVYARLTYLIDFIKAQRPGIRILWSGYAYPNFGEVISDLGPLASTHPFYGLWDGMGQPTFLQLNSILNSYSAAMDTLAANDPQVDFVRCTGIMQYEVGQTSALGISPGGTYAPFTAPLPDGFPDYPSPKNTMRNYIVFRDCFHLTPTAYGYFLNYHTRKFYHKALMDDQYITSEGGSLDGSVSTSGVTNTSLQLGSNGSEELKMQLSFNTTSMPDTGVSKASIFLRRESLTGANPSTGNLLVRVKSGIFSQSAIVEASDFSASGDAIGTPCQFGSTGANGDWIRLELPTSLLPYISSDTLTQFIISAPGASGLVTFTDAADPELAPVLNLTYGPQLVGLNESAQAIADVQIYPNPAQDIVKIKCTDATLLRCEVYDAAGRLCASPVLSGNSFSVEELSKGLYTIRLFTTKGLANRIILRD